MTKAEEIIRQAWSKYPEAVVTFDTLVAGQRKPHFKHVPKNEIRIFIRNSKHQRVYVYRGALEMTATYKGSNTIENAAETNGLKGLDGLMALPNTTHDHHCSDCKEFAVALYISRKDKRLLCLDCFKEEKEALAR